MKLLYCTPWIFNSAGTERVLSMKANYLVREAGYEVVIVTTDQKGRRNFFEFDERIRHYDLGLDYIDDFTKPFISKTLSHYRKNKIYRKKLQSILQKEKPDVCISMFGKEIEFLGKMNTGCKTVGELHFNRLYRENLLLANHKGFFWRLIGHILTRNMRSETRLLDRLVVLTKEDLHEWEKTNSNACQIYNPLPYDEDCQAQLNARNIITVGRLSAQKNYQSLVRAWKIVNEKHPDWSMNIWGDGELKECLSTEIDRCGISKSLILHGRTDNVKSEYLNSSAYVMSSIFEGFPMVLLEAASFGLPLISYECYCGPKDIIRDGVNGFLVKQNDEQALADAICKVIEDEDLRRRMGQAAKETSKEFSQDKILPLWPKFFESLVNSQT